MSTGGQVYLSFCITLVLLLSLGLLRLGAARKRIRSLSQYEGYFCGAGNKCAAVAILGFSTKEACAAHFRMKASMSLTKCAVGSRSFP